MTIDWLIKEWIYCCFICVLRNGKKKKSSLLPLTFRNSSSLFPPPRQQNVYHLDRVKWPGNSVPFPPLLYLLILKSFSAGVKTFCTSLEKNQKLKYFPCWERLSKFTGYGRSNSSTKQKNNYSLQFTNLITSSSSSSYSYLQGLGFWKFNPQSVMSARKTASHSDWLRTITHFTGNLVGHSFDLPLLLLETTRILGHPGPLPGRPKSSAISAEILAFKSLGKQILPLPSWPQGGKTNFKGSHKQQTGSRLDLTWYFFSLLSAQGSTTPSLCCLKLLVEFSNQLSLA